MAQLHPPHLVEAAAAAVREGTDDNKKFLFQLNLKWSDGTFSTSYRSYSEFFDFQCDLLVQFPKEGGSMKGHERIIPFLPGKKLFQRSNRKLAENRLPKIDDYVRTFVTLPEHIVTCDIAFRFFRSNWQEDRLRNGECAPLVSAVKYTVKTMSQDHLLSAGGGSKEGSLDSLAPVGYEPQSYEGLTLSNGKISGI